MQPIYEKSSNKNVHYVINDQFLRFWFRFIYKYTHIIEAGGNDRLKTIAERDFATVSGKSLESYFNELMKESYFCICLCDLFSLRFYCLS